MTKNSKPLPKPSESWKTAWDSLNIPTHLDGLTHPLRRRFLSSLITHEAARRYVWGFPTRSLGVGSLFPDESKQNEVIARIGSILQGQSPAERSSKAVIVAPSPTVSEFRWLVRSYQYQNSVVSEFALNYAPVVYELMTECPNNGSGCEDLLQSSARVLLTDTHDFLDHTDNPNARLGLRSVTQYQETHKLILEFTNWGIFEYKHMTNRTYDELLSSPDPMRYLRDNLKHFSDYQCVRPGLDVGICYFALDSVQSADRNR